jgi:hypothetical protein
VDGVVFVGWCVLPEPPEEGFWCFGGLAAGCAEAAKPRRIVVPAGSDPCRAKRTTASGAVRRPTVLPEVTSPQSPRRAVCPAASVTGEPLIARPDTVPLPCIAETLVAVTRPPKSETDCSVTDAVLHVEPPAVAAAKATTGAVAG